MSAPPDLPAVVRELAPELRQTFELRVERWWPDLRSGLVAVYGEDAAGRLESRLLRLAARAYAERDPELRRLDQARTLAPDWFQSPRMLGYAAYADRFAGTLAGVAERLDYLRELGITYLHLMPLLRPRPGDSDGGYAVADYRSVRDDLGSVADLRALAKQLRAAGMSLVLDLVLNHVAREHPWAVAAREGDRRYRDYFHWFPDRQLPDQYESTLPEVFPDFAPGNFTWDDALQAWVWTTFNEFQWDLNWSNTAVFAEFADLILYLANAGVEVLRLDAIAFLWKRLGSNCQNQPEVHALTQALRAVVRIACPAVVLKAEAIVAPDDLVHYLGKGRHHGKVSDLAYHNSLMVQVWSMLATRDVRLATRTLQRLPPIPPTTAWITYLRCHDDIGWAIDDADAASVGLSGPAHRAFLSDFYTGAFPGSFARGLVFQANPATGDRRVSGMTSSLAGLAAAENEEDQRRAVARIALAHAVVLGWGGVPVLWMGDEIALPDDEGWADEPGHEDDNRWSHRPRMDWKRAAQRHDVTTVPGAVYAALRHLAGVRSALPHFHASVAPQVLDPSDPGVLAVLRQHPVGDLLALYNVTESARSWPGWRTLELGFDRVRDALSGARIEVRADADLVVGPYTALWLIAA